MGGKSTGGLSHLSPFILLILPLVTSDAVRLIQVASPSNELTDEGCPRCQERRKAPKFEIFSIKKSRDTLEWAAMSPKIELLERKMKMLCNAPNGRHEKKNPNSAKGSGLKGKTRVSSISTCGSSFVPKIKIKYRGFDSLLRRERERERERERCCLMRMDGR